MMRHELQDRIGPVEDDQWQALERIYAYHPDIPDVGAKDAFASMFLITWPSALRRTAP